MLIADSDEWFTPIFLLKRVQEFYGGNFVDPASSRLVEKEVGATEYFSLLDDGLIQKWRGNIWLNPPYSRELVKQFTQKLIYEYEAKNVAEALLLLNASTETKWFQNVAVKATLRLDIRGRLHFWHPNKKSNSPRYGQSLFYFGKRPTIFIQKFGDLGITYSRVIGNNERHDKH